MPSLVLSESAPAAPNTGAHTLVSATLAGVPVLAAAAGDRVDLLDGECNLLQALPLADAFPHGLGDEMTVEAVAVDVAGGRIAAVSQRRVAVWAQRENGQWRVHSTFKVLHAVTALDFVQGKIVLAGEGATLWEVEESSGFPSWNKIGSLALPQPVAMARLSPSGSVLATVTSGSSTVLLHSIISSSAPSSSRGTQYRLQFRSRAAHSVRIRSISWRPSDDVADSGPVLFTLTLDGRFRIWGSMIDEPSFFSLWATLDVSLPASLPRHLPLTTLYWRTTPMSGRQEGTGGMEDSFVTVFADGSVGVTTVSNFDSRPPTCLTQSTALLSESVFSPAQLASLRHPHLLPSASSPSTSTSTSSASFRIVGRSSRSNLVRARVAHPQKHSPKATSPPISLVGDVRRLVTTADGEAVMALGAERLQCWEMGEEEVIAESVVAEVGTLEADAGVAIWRNGHAFALAQNDTLSIYSRPKSHSATSRFQLVASSPIHTFPSSHATSVYTSPLSFFASHTSDSPFTTLVYISRSGVVRNFSYHAGTHELVSVSPTNEEETDVSSVLPEGVEIVSVVPIPPSGQQAEEGEMAFVVCDSEGTLYRWTAQHGELEEGWVCEGKGDGVKTGLSGVEKLAVASDATSAIVSASGGERTLSIWDPKASEFSSGEQFSLPLPDSVVALAWSSNDRLLAVASPSTVELYCAQRLDDLSGAPSWSCVASLSVVGTLPIPVTAISWLSTGLCLAAGDHLFFYSPKLDTKPRVDIHKLAEEKLAPLPLHHPQLLFQAILQGHFDAVVQILSNLSAELTDEGHLTPLPTTDEKGRAKKQKLTLDAFLTVPGMLERKINAPKKPQNDIFAALTTASNRDRHTPHRKLAEADVGRLLSAMRQRSLRGLSPLEHDHLAVLAKTVFETQSRKSSIDENGLRFLISLRSFYLYHSPSSPTSLPTTSATLNGPLVSQRLKYRDMLWAFHSDSQPLLLEEATKACGGKLTWEKARTLGVALWIKSNETLAQTMETIGRTEFTKPDVEDRDPISATLFYLALRKKHIVLTFWKQSLGHADQRSMLKFLANDFEEQRWRTAAMKNAYALMSKQRFLFAAAFFLLGGSLKDAVSVILRQLNDFQLAIAITRTYEGGDDGPVLRFILEETVVPLAFRSGYRWLASWAFWLLNRKDLAVQVIVTPLPELARRLPYKLEDVKNAPREDPALVLLSAQLRSWSLQTVKGAIGVAGKTEFNFVIHISRILCRMGCHVLALNLLRNWRFLPPPPPPPPAASTSQQRPNPLVHRRHSLLLSSTKLDLPIPSSELPSRVSSPVSTLASDLEAEERERQRQQYREVVKTVKVEAKAPAEFSFDAFGF